MQFNDEKTPPLLPQNGNLQHVSGMSYTVDLSIEPTVVLDENGMFVRVDGERCVKDVIIGG